MVFLLFTDKYENPVQDQEHKRHSVNTYQMNTGHCVNSMFYTEET